jgi:hypothetical protein
MQKRLLVVVVPALGLGACTQQTSSTPLSELKTTTLEVVARGQLNVEVHVDETAGCPTIGADVVARFDGSPMQVSRGGYDENASGCYPIAFWFDELPMATINGVENVGAASELLIADHSQTWRLDTTRLFANNFVIDSARGEVTWTDVAQITSARLDQAITGINGNVIHFAPGATVTQVEALAHPVPTLCDGPGTCVVNLEGFRTWDINP